jgi:hypothetical protein
MKTEHWRIMMNNKNRADYKIYVLPLITIVQLAIFLVPLLLVGMIYSSQTYRIALSYLYPLVSAGWILTLGNGRLSMNIKECKLTVDISKMKYKSFIVVTSAEHSKLSVVDYYYQISGYLLIIFGIMLSSSMLILQKLNNIISDWISFDNTYTSIILIYTISICFLGTVLRVYYLVIDYLWYKRQVHK